MSKTTTLLLVIAIFAAVAVHSVNSAAADSLALTNTSFYKEKGAAKLIPAGDASLADTSYGRRLIPGKNSKTNYLIYQTNTPTDSTSSATKEQGGITNVNFRKVDVNKLAFAEGSSAVAVTGFKWGGPSSVLVSGASVKNNVTLLGELYADPKVENARKSLYAYIVDLDKNEKTEILIASGNYTDANVQTTVDLKKVYASGGLTVFVYSTTTTTSSGGKTTTILATLKDGQLGATATIKEVSYTGNSASEYYSDFDGVGEDIYVVLQVTSGTYGVDRVAIETVYPYTVSDKEIKAGTPAVLNTQAVAAAVYSNQYSFRAIHAHAKDRWVALYTNTTEANSLDTMNYVVKSSNDSAAFKVVHSITEVADGKTSSSITGYDKYFGGLVLYITDGTTSSGESSPDQFTVSYQTYAGDFSILGTKTAFLTYSGKYVEDSDWDTYRLGDSKAVNLLVHQVLKDSSVNPTKVTDEGVYFGQLFQKSFGATIQSVLAVCSFILAALFTF